jgi:hypothetical protein
MMFSVTVRINIQKSKVVNLEFCYELRRSQLVFYTPRVYFTNNYFQMSSKLFLMTVWSPVSIKHQIFNVTNPKYIIGIYSR